MNKPSRANPPDTRGKSKPSGKKTRVSINSVSDIVSARQKGRDMASQLGFSPTESTLIATAISELARNIVLYARSGEVVLESTKNDESNGIVIVARDYGPGIPDVQRALMGGYSTSGGLGLGLPGVRQMMDELDVDTELGEGTTVTAIMWRN